MGISPGFEIVRARLCRVNERHVAGADAGGDHHRAVHQSLIDYGLPKLTGGLARGMATVAGFTNDKPDFRSPWHYHECHLQVSIVVAGSAEIGFDEAFFVRVGPGDIAFIPGQVIHDVREPSANYQVAELTFPDTFNTIAAPAPIPGLRHDGRIWGQNCAVRCGATGGYVRYAYPVPAGLDSTYHIMRGRRSRLDPFCTTLLDSAKPFQFLLMLAGRRTLSIDGIVAEAGAADLLVLPRGAICHDLDASADYEGLWLSTLA